MIYTENEMVRSIWRFTTRFTIVLFMISVACPVAPAQRDSSHTKNSAGSSRSSSNTIYDSQIKYIPNLGNDSLAVKPMQLVEKKGFGRFSKNGTPQCTTGVSVPLEVVSTLYPNYCFSCVNRFYFRIHVHAGDDNVTYAKWVDSWTQPFHVDVKVEGFDPVSSSWITIQTPDAQDYYSLSISATSPEQVAVHEITNNSPSRCCMSCTEPTFTTLRFTIVNNVGWTNSATVDGHIRVDVSYSEELQVGRLTQQLFVSNPVAIANSYVNCSNNSNLCSYVTNNPVELAWDLDQCADEYPSYQVQVLRLRNVDETRVSDETSIKAKIDWTQALTLETDDKTPHFVSTLAEGSGYYVWRVRPIYNIHSGDISNPFNLGAWSHAPVDGEVIIDPSACTITNNGNTIDDRGLFYYKQFDDDKNWLFSRSFSEPDHGLRPVETMLYYNSLMNPIQMQRRIFTSDSLLVSQNVPDFSSRLSLSSMMAPIDQSKIEYKPRLLLTGSNQNQSNFHARHYDADSKLLAPDPLNTNGEISRYYSNDNPIVNIPSADGYPYTRSIYYSDGRLKELSGAGLTHNVAGDRKTTRVFYSDVSDQELTSIFGDEAPRCNTVTKVVTVDCDGVASVRYLSLDGKLLATCLTDAGELTNCVDPSSSLILEDANHPPAGSMHNLVGEKVNIVQVNDVSSTKTKVNPNLRVLSKRLSFTVPTVVDFDYEIYRRLFSTGASSGSCQICAECDYAVSFDIRDAETPDQSMEGYPVAVSTQSLQRNCNELNPPTAQFAKHAVTFQPGTYLVQVSIEKNKTYPVNIPTPIGNLELDLTVLEQAIRSILNSLPARNEFVENQFSFVNEIPIADPAHPTAVELLATYNYHRNQQNGIVSFPAICEEIVLPEVQLCPDDIFCGQAHPDFEKYLLDQFLSDPLTSFQISKYKGLEFDNVNQTTLKWITINYFFRSDDGGPKFEHVSNIINSTDQVAEHRGFGLFNQIVENMLAETGSCHYDCKTIWTNWRAAVQQYMTLVKNHMQDCRVALQSGNEHIEVSHQTGDQTIDQNMKFDLLEVFLQLCGKRVKGWSSSAYDPTNGYLRRPYSFFKDPGPGDGKRNVCICNLFGTQGNPQGVEPTELTSCPTDESDPVASSWVQLYHCINDKQQKFNSKVADKPDNAAGDFPLWNKCIPPTTCRTANSAEWAAFDNCMKQWAIASVKDRSNACSSRCNAAENRKYFADVVRAEYKRENLSVPSYDDPDLLCKVNLMIGDCIKGCTLTYNQSTGEQGSAAELTEYKLRMDMLPEVRLYAGGCPNGYRQLPDAGSVKNIIDLLVAHLNQKWKERSSDRNQRPLLINFRTQYALPYLRNVLQLSDSQIPPCFLSSQNDSWWNITVYEDLPGEFWQPGFTNQGGVCTNCRLLKRQPYVALNHPWISALNTYLNNLYGLDIVDQNQVPLTVNNDNRCNFWEPVMGHNDHYNYSARSMCKYNYAQRITSNSAHSNYVVSVAFAQSKCGVRNIFDNGAGGIYNQLNAYNQQLKQALAFYNVNGLRSNVLAFRVGDKDDYNNNISSYIDSKDDHKLGTITTAHIQYENEPAALFWKDDAGTQRWKYYGGIQIVMPRKLASNANRLTDDRTSFSTSLYPKIHAESNNSYFNGTNFSDLRGFQNYTYIYNRANSNPGNDGMSQSYFCIDANANFTPTQLADKIHEFTNITPTHKYTDFVGFFYETAQGYLGYTKYDMQSLWQDDRTSPLNNGNGTGRRFKEVRFYYDSTSEISGCDLSSLCQPSASCFTCITWNRRSDVVVAVDPHLIHKSPPLTCEELQVQRIKELLSVSYNKLSDKITDRLTAAYKRDCDIDQIQDELRVQYKLQSYHYTLYYYDRAGNLVRTVPPKGVKMDPARTRISPNPQHNMASCYWNNSTGRNTDLRTPDSYRTWLTYNKAGQLRFSMNSRQQQNENTAVGAVARSYIKYDYIGRVIETGEVSESDIGSNASAIQAAAEIATFPQELVTRKRVASFVYGYPGISLAIPTPYQNLLPENVNKKVCLTSYDEDGSPSTTTDQTRMWYSYDTHGNVKWVVHQVFGLEAGVSVIAKTEYDYDLVSGKVQQIVFHKGYTDQMFRRFRYDADGRLCTVETSRDSVVWDKDASYEYYAHGPLRRASIGEDSVQGIDYVYTLQGWLKGINYPSLSSAQDPGKDGSDLGSGKTRFPVDAFGMTLGYYEGDFSRSYTSSGTTSNSPFNSSGAQQPENINSNKPLYNGNITSWISQTKASGLTGSTQPVAEGTTANMYQYDVLDRLRDELFKQFTNISPYWNGSLNGAYDASYSYDPNGNILNLKRNGVYKSAGVPTIAEMDNLDYQYDEGAYNNILNSVNDNSTSDANFSSVTARDIKSTGNGTMNYSYYKDGSLKMDNREGISQIYWNHTGKVEQIVKNGSTIKYLYDISGNKVRRYYHSLSGDVVTYYMHGAFGMQESIYEQNGIQATVDINQIELCVYGNNDYKCFEGDQVNIGAVLENTKSVLQHSWIDGISYSRIGVVAPQGLKYNTQYDALCYKYMRNVSEKNYEIKDYLGNVRAIIADEKKSDAGSFLTELRSYSSYYGYGMMQPERIYSDMTSYRYGYCGKEKEDQMKGENNSYDFGSRLYDVRLARWLSVDPCSGELPFFSSYQYTSNNPIRYYDPDGKFLADVHVRIVRNALNRVGTVGLRPTNPNDYGLILANDFFRMGLIGKGGTIGGFILQATGFIGEWPSGILTPDCTDLSDQNQFHFDNRMDYSSIAANMEWVNNNQSAIIQQYISGSIDACNFGRSMGIYVFHPIADFYSHSNYVQLWLQYKKDHPENTQLAPLYDEALSDPSYAGFKTLLSGLHTDHYPSSDGDPHSHRNTNLDVGSGSEFVTNPLYRAVLKKRNNENGGHEPSEASRLAEELATRETEKRLGQIHAPR